MDNRFKEIIKLIEQSRSKAIRAVNTELINLYWLIGENISNKMNSAEWGDSVVTELANYIKKIEPNLKGFSDKNIWRMKQFYETYKGDLKLSTVVREISWTHKSLIFLYFFEVPNWHLKLLCSLEDDPSSLCERHPKCPQQSWGIKSWDSSLVLRICIILKLFQMHLT